jgi:hypothetical protein
VGLNLYISSLRFRRPITDVYRDVMPFVGVLALGLVVVMVLPRLSSWTVEDDIAALRQGALDKGLAPDQAWALECIQQDPPNYRPCTPEDIERYGKDGRRVALVEAASEHDKLAAEKLADPTTSEEEKRKLRRELGQETEDDLDREFEEAFDDDDDDDEGDAGAPKKADAGKEDEDEDEGFDDDDDEPEPKGNPKPEEDEDEGFDDDDDEPEPKGKTAPKGKTEPKPKAEPKPKSP